MAAQILNTDVIPKMTEAIEVLKEDVIKNLVTGSENTLDIAKDTGSEKLIKSASNFYEATQEQVKSLNEIAEVLSTYVEQYKRVRDAL